jgi:CheY-like chemotaxis protein
MSAPRPGRRLSFDVLLAEDDKVSIHVAARMLEKSGCRVETVEDGAQAISKLKDRRFDLVLMDVQMPVMDGLEATRAIRSGRAGQDAKDIPIIAMTAYAMSGDREKFVDSGMDDYIAKPVSVDELNRVLSLAAERRSSP